GALRQYFSDMGQSDLFEQSSEVQALRGMRSALTPKLPVSQSAELRQRLKQALETENFELAAILRDELRLLGDCRQSLSRPPHPPHCPHCPPQGCRFHLCLKAALLPPECPTRAWRRWDGRS